MKEITFTKTFEDRVFTDHRADQFWCIISTAVREGELVQIEFIWNFPPRRKLAEWKEYLVWAVECWAKIFAEYGQDVASAVPVHSGALHFDNVNEELARQLRAKESPEGR